MPDKSLHPFLGALFAAVLAALPLVPAAAQVIDRVLVVVNDGVITETEYITAMRRTITELRARNQRVPERAALEEQVMEQLILERIQLQMADKLGISVEPAQVESAIDDIAARQGLTAEQLFAQARRVGFDPDAYRAQIRKQLRIQRVIDREVRRRVIVSESEINDKVAALSASESDSDVEYHVAHISLLLDDANDEDERVRKLELARQIHSELEAGADFGDLARRYSGSPTAENGGDLGWRPVGNLPDLFRGAVRGLDVGEISDVLDSPAGIHIVKLLDRRGGVSEMVDQWHVRHILIPANSEEGMSKAREEALRLRERIQRGEDFAELARVHSGDPGSRVNGGDLGWVSPGETVPAFEEAVRNLAIGALSEPVETPFGVHLIEVLDHRRQDLGERQLRIQAERMLQEEKGREAYEQWLRRIRDEAFVKFRVKPG